MSARLTKDDRQKMARALVAHRFADRIAELSAESNALFDLCYAERYDAEAQRLINRLAKKLPGETGSLDQIDTNANGMNISVGGVGLGEYRSKSWVIECKSRPSLNRHVRLNLSGALAERVSAFGMACEKFRDDVREAYRRALGMLEQFASGKKLEAEWPEAIPVIGHLIPANDRALPVVQTAEINDEFGLPPSETEAA